MKTLAACVGFGGLGLMLGGAVMAGAVAVVFALAIDLARTRV